MSNVIAPIKRATASVIRCGGCKATGVEHKWNDKGEYLPTGNICPTCAGSGAAPQPAR